ncbi:MAG TPA: RraA family protein [Sphingomicrobium sp.]
MTSIADRLANLSVAHLCDGCLRVATPMRVAPPLFPLLPGQRLQGRVRPVRHYGSVDVFLEALETSGPEDILVVDNDGRDDEGCIGDLTVLEVQQAGLGGIVIWGRHRDSAILRSIALPMFTRGACARGPVRLDPRGDDAFRIVRIGDQLASAEDWVVADDDGVIFIADSIVGDVIAAAESIRDTEYRQTRAMASGASLRTQLRFADFLESRAADPSVDFRTHLRGLNAAIEE